MSKIQPHALFSGTPLATYAIQFSSLMSLFWLRVFIFPDLLVVWCIQRWCGQCWGTIEKITGSPQREFYADAIEEAPGVKVRVLLGSIQMRQGQYTPRQMSELISSFFAREGGCVCVCVGVVCVCCTTVCLVCREKYLFYVE